MANLSFTYLTLTQFNTKVSNGTLVDGGLYFVTDTGFNHIYRATGVDTYEEFTRTMTGLSIASGKLSAAFTSGTSTQLSLVPNITIQEALPTNSSADIATTDTLRVALGKLQKRIANAETAAGSMLKIKGSIGTGGTVTALPSSNTVGDAYRVITAGTYASQTCEVGDLLIAITANTWMVLQNNIDAAGLIGPSGGDVDVLAVNDDFSANGTVSSDLIPDISDTHSLGSAGQEWSQIHAAEIFTESLSADSINLGGSSLSTLLNGKLGASAAAAKVAQSMIVKLAGGTTEGTNMFTFNGAAAKTIDITPAGIGAAAASHTHIYAWSEITGKPSTFTPSTHTHSYIPLSGSSAITGNLVPSTAVTYDLGSLSAEWNNIYSETLWALDKLWIYDEEDYFPDDEKQNECINVFTHLRDLTSGLSSHTHSLSSLGAAASNHTHGDALGDSSGFMSAADKRKLDLLPDGILSSTLSTRNDYSDGNHLYIELVSASSTALGGVKIGYTTNAKNYPLVLDDSGKAYVNVPWTDTNTVYTHPTSAGNKHIPAGGSAGQVLVYSSAGTAAWANNLIWQTA